ncbi:MAG: phenylalanine--tRNA ligase subunit beta [Candidatus Micrarchaeia archaeon]
MTFEKAYLFSLTKFKLSDARLIDQITKMGFDVEDNNASEISVDITPNRPDLLDIYGFARALRYFMHRSKRFDYKVESNVPALSLSVGQNVKAIRPFISSFVAEGKGISENELKYLVNFSEKLGSIYGRNRKRLAMGLHDFSKIKPPVSYDAFSDLTFIPLNESREMRFSDVLKENEKGISYSHTIRNVEGKTFYPALVDAEGVMSFIPIINSNRTKLSTGAKSIFVDITGTSQYIIEKAADLFASVFIDLGYTISPVEVKYKSKAVMYPQMSSTTITIPASRIEENIGVRIGPNNIVSLANKMGYKAAIVGSNIRFVTPPYRLDIFNEQDVIEDIAIGYGYDYIQPEPIPSVQQGSLEDVTRLTGMLSKLMLGLGFSEMMNSYLTSEETNFDKMLIKHDSDYVKIKFSKEKQLNMLRNWILPQLIYNASLSQHEKLPQKTFELDMVFSLAGGKTLEEYHLAGLIVDAKANFNEIKGIVEALLSTVGLQYSIKEDKMGSFIAGRQAGIYVGNKKVGFFGEIHPQVLSNFGLEEPATAFEINISQAFQQ